MPHESHNLALASSRAIRCSTGGWVLKSAVQPPPDKGFMMKRCAVAGDPDDLQIMYGIGGERRLTEYEIPWLPGYEDSKPVRIGNAAAAQLQLDVFGELLDALYVARKAGLAPDQAAWAVERALRSSTPTGEARIPVGHIGRRRLRSQDRQSARPGKEP